MLTTLRRFGQIDDVLARCLEQPDRLPTRERCILRLGAAQILFLGTPAYAAVNGAVNATATRLKGLTNAVLRRIDREGAALVASQDAARQNTPDWLWRQLCAFGETTARAIAAVHLLEPPLDLTVAGDPAPWATRLDAEVLPTGSLRLRQGGAVPDLDGFAEGAWWVQDAAAALPARLLLRNLPRGARVADLCAAPGGKTAQLAAAGMAVTAVDREPKRLERVRENLTRLRLSATLVAADAGAWKAPHPMDAVLLDAPCTATGTIRRNPDIAWHKDDASARSLAPVQEALLQAAANMLSPHGSLVYCVCSLDAREGPERIDGFLSQRPEFRRAPVAMDEVGGLKELVTPDGDLRTLPCHLADRGGMDGFYAARLTRTGRP